MKLWEAMKIINEGGKVRRENWDKGTYICKDGNGMIVRKFDHMDDILKFEILVDINNENWEIFE